MKKKIVLFIVAFISWCLLNWVPDWQHLLMGLAAALFVAYITGDLFLESPHMLNPKRYLLFIGKYTPIFIWEVIKANIDVAYRISHPMLPINPGIVKVKTSLKSDVAVTFLANSITLTPGTMTVDVDMDNGFLYVHWIDVKSKDVEEATRLIAQRFENILRKIFD